MDWTTVSDLIDKDGERTKFQQESSGNMIGHAMWLTGVSTNRVYTMFHTSFPDDLKSQILMTGIASPFSMTIPMKRCRERPGQLLSSRFCHLFVPLKAGRI